MTATISSTSSAMPSPTWYDLLDVEPTASTDRIRAAWKAAVADLDPTDRRFRTLSEAAAVLLDPDRRSSYDAELAAVVDEDEPDRSVAARPRPVVATAAGALRRLPDVPGWVLVVVAILTAAVMTSAGVSLVRGGGGEEVVTAANTNDTTSTLEADYGQPVRHDHATLIEEPAAQALRAAKQAVPGILSYDYRHLDADQQKAHGYMTASYRKKYDELFALIKDNAPSTKTIVRALPPVDAGVVRAAGDRVQVLVFFDLPTTNAKNSKPIPYQQYATLTMVKEEGNWLVDDVRTTPAG